jgi:hypothetical protein
MFVRFNNFYENLFWIIYFLKNTQWQCKLNFDNSTAMYKDLPKKSYTLAGFEPGIFCFWGGRDDHYATPPRTDLPTKPFQLRQRGKRKWAKFRKRLRRQIDEGGEQDEEGPGERRSLCRLTRWVCEKSRLKCCPNHFCQNQCVFFYVAKSSTKI